MADLKVAFWNVKNLLDPSSGDTRAPRTGAELDAKISAIARVLNGLCDGRIPDLIGLAEIHTEDILATLESRLSSRFRIIWEPCLSTDHVHTGLAVLARRERFSALEFVRAYTRTERGRPRYLITECRLRERDDPFFFVVNHWRSRTEIKGPDPFGFGDRLDTAKALGAWVQSCPRTSCIVVIGDFNAEPFEQPFGEAALWAVRHFRGSLRLPFPRLYNTAWRFLCEPDPCENVIAYGETYKASRTKTTFDDYNADSLVLDQLLVSSRAIRGGPIMLQERTVEYVCDPRIGRRQAGHLRPTAWSYNAGSPIGVSDHFPLIATFRVSTETVP